MSLDFSTDSFDGSLRHSMGPVFDLPFDEGLPTPGKAQRVSRWIRERIQAARGSDTAYVRLYHGTHPNLPILEEGLRPTSLSRRRSYQSTSGYVYLAVTPERAETFGRMGNGGQCRVYEVIVSLRRLKADLDQLTNQRSVGMAIGNTLGESAVYGGGFRVSGPIDPWAIRAFSVEPQEEVASDLRPDAVNLHAPGRLFTPDF